MRDARGACHPKCTKSTRAASAATISAVQRVKEAGMLALPTRAGDPAVTRGPVSRAGKCVRREREGTYERYASLTRKTTL